MGLKARVKATGEIVDVILKQVDQIQQKYVNCETGVSYYREELVFDVYQKCFPYDEDYWTRLEHQAAIAAMQGLMTILPNIGGIEGRTPKDEIVDIAIETAHALVGKYKKEERK